MPSKNEEKWEVDNIQETHFSASFFGGVAIDQSIDSWWFLLGFSPPHDLAQSSG